MPNDQEYPKEPPRPELEFDYAWKWFSLHATQRTSMFNYFLIMTGIFANAFVVLLKERQTNVQWLSIGLGLLGAAASLAFFLLDIRNRQLVQIGENQLRDLEGKAPEKIATTIWSHHYNQDDGSLIRHKYLIPGVELLVLFTFLGVVLLSCLFHPSTTKEAIRIELDSKTLDDIRQLATPANKSETVRIEFDRKVLETIKELAVPTPKAAQSGPNKNTE